MSNNTTPFSRGEVRAKRHKYPPDGVVWWDIPGDLEDNSVYAAAIPSGLAIWRTNRYGERCVALLSWDELEEMRRCV